MDLVECPEIAEAISRNVMEFYRARAMRAIEASDCQIDIIGSGGIWAAKEGCCFHQSCGVSTSNHTASSSFVRSKIWVSRRSITLAAPLCR